MLILRWPKEILAKAGIPAESKEFLATEGLPEFVSVPWLEFGIFDSNPDLVISEFSDDMIMVIRADGLVELENSEGNCFYMNRDVKTLGAFLSIFMSGRPLGEVRRTMAQLDPQAVGPSEGCFWTQVLNHEDFASGA